MRLFLTASELRIPEGSELLELCCQVCEDGELDLAEIIQLRKWLARNQAVANINAIPYLVDIMKRITIDGQVDSDERMELHLAVERVIPKAMRHEAETSRKKLEVTKRNLERKRREREREAKRRKEQAERRKWDAEMDAQAEAEDRRHDALMEAEDRLLERFDCEFSKIAGVAFPNDDGTERQEMLKNVVPMEQLALSLTRDNSYSDVACEVRRRSGEMLGHLCEDDADQVHFETVGEGRSVFCIATKVTGGTRTRPTRGCKIALIYAEPNVTDAELASYVSDHMMDA